MWFPGEPAQMYSSARRCTSGNPTVHVATDRCPSIRLTLLSILLSSHSFPKTTYANHIPLSLCRLYSKGRVLGYKRAKRNTRPNTSLIQIEGVATKEDAQFYLGKRVAYVYRAKREVQGSKVRVIWG